MSSIFYLGSTNSDLTGGREFSKYLEDTTEAASSVSIDTGGAKAQMENGKRSLR